MGAGAGLLWLIAAGAGLLLPVAARAQTAEADAVPARPRPDYEPEGIVLADLLDWGRYGLAGPGGGRSYDGAGATLLRPSIDLGSFYDDNVLRTNSHHQGDMAAKTRVAIEAASDLGDHGLSAGAFGQSVQYARLSAQSYREYGAHAGGFVEAGDEARAEVQLSQERLNQPIEDAGGLTGQTRPMLYDLTTLTVKGNYGDGDWQLAPRGVFTRRLFLADPPLVFGNEQDYSEATGTFRIGRSLSAASLLFLEPQVDLRRFRASVGLDGYRHDSSGYQVLGGLRWDLSGVTFLEFGVGWLEQDYVDPAFPTVRGPAFQGKAVWNPQDWITVSLETGRRVDEGQLPGVAGIQSTFATASVDYELAENWLLNTNAGYADAQYRGAGAVARTDNIWRYGLGMRYLVDERISLAASWSGFSRGSTAVAQGLDYNSYSAAVSLRW